MTTEHAEDFMPEGHSTSGTLLSSWDQEGHLTDIPQLSFFPTVLNDTNDDFINESSILLHPKTIKGVV